MGRVFISDSTGAGIYVFSDDHCPAHVHARHRGEGWIARLRFSYLGSTVELISMIPVKNVPLQRVVNRLLSDVQVRLPDCLSAAQLVVDAKNNMFGEPVGRCARTGKNQASLEIGSEREADR